MYVPRILEPAIRRASQQYPVVLLTGARQVGRTTLLRQLSQRESAYVTLDDPLVSSLAKSDPALFMQRFPPPVRIDEIQYAAELLPYIKMAADRAGQPGLFWLTGSQQFPLVQGVSESLAGRAAVLHLLGLSRPELLGHGLTAVPFVPTPAAPGPAELPAQPAHPAGAVSPHLARGAAGDRPQRRGKARSVLQFLRADLPAARRARPGAGGR